MTDTDVPEADEPDDELVETPAVEHRLVVTDAQSGERLDAVIAAAIEGLSRAAVQRLLEDGQIQLNRRPAVKAGQRLRTGDAIVVTVPPPESVELVPEDIPLTILFEDADIIVIDKPAGLVVHPAAGHPRGTLVNALLYHCKDLSGIGGELRPGIVHRLDKDTTGVMVATKNDRAHAVISAAFAAKSRGEPGGILREYIAIAAPPPSALSGTLRTLHGRHPADRKRFSSKVERGKQAVTHWTTIERLGADADARKPAVASMLRIRLETGRTHQIRVHAADHGWPLIGDPLYGKPPQALAAVARQLGRQALHAALLELEHPSTGARLRFESPLPADLVAVRDALSSATRSST